MKNSACALVSGDDTQMCRLYRFHSPHMQQLFLHASAQTFRPAVGEGLQGNPIQSSRSFAQPRCYTRMRRVGRLNLGNPKWLHSYFYFGLYDPCFKARERMMNKGTEHPYLPQS